MDLKSAARALKRIAPAAATALGSPAGGLAATVIAGALGVEKTPAAIVEAIKTDPGAAIRLASIEQELAQAAMLDTQHARETVGGSRWSYAIDASVMLLVAVLIYATVFMEIPPENQQALNIILGAVLGSYGTVITYHRGSSAGSAARAAQIERQSARDSKR